jgi:putative cell wall-binding protein
VLGPASSTVGVLILGGTLAVGPAVEQAITAAGYQVRRIAGSDRFQTAIDVANELKPDVVLEATGFNFPDGVSAGAAAAHVHGAVLLTNGSSQAPATAGYLQQNPVLTYAVGAAAATADPTATPIVGSDRYDTAAKTASIFFVTPVVADVATGGDYADALAGGSRAAQLGAPILLTNSSLLSKATETYLQGNARWVDTADVFGGTLAVSDTVLQAVQHDITET